jgi:hypothetical protein
MPEDSEVKLPRKLAHHEPVLGCDASLGDFWSWAYSDVLININRAVFAEFIVGYALGIAGDTRRDWDFVVHEYNGKTIEVKATGFAQRWRKGKKRSASSFNIAKKIPVRWGGALREGGRVSRPLCRLLCFLRAY